MSNRYGPRIVTDGLVLCLDAADRNSYPGTGTTWTDLSGNGNNGTLTNSPSYSNINKGTMVLDGSDDYIITPTNAFPSGNVPIAIEAWFRWFGNGSSNVDVIFAYGPDNNSRACPIIGVDSSNYAVLEFGNASGLVTSSSTISSNTWYHMLTTYDTSTTKLYLNSVVQNTTNFTTANIQTSGSNGNYAGIGCFFSNFGNIVSSPRRYGTFNGNIAGVKLYNRALSATEVAQNYNATKGRFNP